MKPATNKQPRTERILQNSERLAKQDGQTTRPKTLPKQLPKQQQQQQQKALPNSNGNVSNTNPRRSVTNNTQILASKNVKTSHPVVSNSSTEVTMMNAETSLTQTANKSGSNKRAEQIERRKALALQRIKGTSEQVIQALYSKNMSACLPAHKLAGSQKLTVSGLLLDKSCNTTRFGEKGGPTKWTVLVFSKFDSIPPSCGRVSPNGNFAEIPVKSCTNPERAKNEPKNMATVGTIPFGSGIYNITVMATSASAPIVEELTRNPTMKMVTVVGIRAEQYTNPKNQNTTISYLADNVIFESSTDKSIRSYYSIPGGIPALFNQILSKVFPEPIIFSLNFGSGENGVTKEECSNENAGRNGDGDDDNDDVNDDGTAVGHNTITQNQDSTNGNLGTSLVQATPNNVIAPVPVILSAEEQKKEDERKEAERTAAKKQKKDAVRKKLSEFFVYTGYNCSHVLNFGPNAEFQQELFKSAFGGSDSAARLKIDRIPHDVGKIDPKTRLPSQTTDFYCVIKKDGQLPKCKPIFQTAAVVSAQWEIGDGQEIFPRVYEQCVVVLPAFKSANRTYLQGAVGTGSPIGIEVYMAHANRLSISVIAFPSDPEANNSSYKFSDPTKPTYQVSLLASEFTSNIASYVLQEQGIPISIEGMIKRLLKAWTPEGPKATSLAKVKFSSQGEKVTLVSLEITDDTIKRRWPERFAAGTDGQLLDAYLKNPTNQRWTRTKRNVYTASKEEGQWNRGYYLITEGNFRFTNVDDFKGKKYYSLPAVVFPQEFHKFLRTLSHGDACKITDILFNDKLNPDSLQGDALTAFNFLKFPEEFHDFLSGLPPEESLDIMSLFHDGLPVNDNLEGNALLAFELLSKIGYDHERYKELLSLDTFPELTYEIQERDIPDILNFGTERAIIPGKKLANSPFAIGTGIADQYKNDIYYKLCAGYKVTEKDVDEYYEKLIASADTLKQVVPTANLWSRVDDNEEEEEEEEGLEDNTMTIDNDYDQDMSDISVINNGTNLDDYASGITLNSNDDDGYDNTTGGCDDGDSTISDTHYQNPPIEYDEESQIDDNVYVNTEFVLNQSQDEADQSNDTAEYEDIFGEEPEPEPEPQTVKRKLPKSRESSKLGEKRDRNQTKNSSSRSKRQKLAGDFD